jgi:hypothetical protein
VLAAALDALQRDPAGSELSAALEDQAGADLELIYQPGLDPREQARLRRLAGQLHPQPALAELIRGGAVESLALASGDPKAWLLACRALKHLPAWVLESPAERAERVAADQQWRRQRGRRPGSTRPAQPLFGSEAQQQAEPAQAAGPAPARTLPPAAPDEPDGWFDPIRKFDPLDQALLDALHPAKARRERRMLTTDAAGTIYSGWVDLAYQLGPNRDLVIRHPQTGERVTLQAALDRVREIEDYGIAGMRVRVSPVPAHYTATGQPAG